MMPPSNDSYGAGDGQQQQQEQNAAWLQAPPPQTSGEQHEAELFSPLCTLDEPVRETIMRDVNAVFAKLKVVLIPMDRMALPFQQYMAVSITSSAASDAEAVAAQPAAPVASAVAAGAAATAGTPDEPLSENDRKVIQSLKDWDLWGPLVLCLSLAVLLSLKAPTNQASLVFAAVFCSYWAGGTVVTVNAQLLGGTISFFQSLCVMGYSMFPLVIAAFIIGCFKLIISTWMWFDLIFVTLGFMWSSRVAAVFLSLYIKPEKRFLALYPVFFIYTFLGWMILVF
mmetsp:Transcript_13927/g.18179  ORF Transcript_13927/g.18179 Transcript_13927/m.18179 type:complete len:283 (+) Transcript_13927:65-913(+)|eukprot:CAMPEP_0198151438 /NCGR_PEP_ID=MMETSP1443-20131203/55547_1 /TAXON_ID=186043 /ORGANISM="Entomoneis sp., Strain CCMP2396" /LENGTH=282 /DNA_ID=CAMNT_0043817089 /DNA_START=74 /DNA_END=922 /DNA_ORIENTATION=-